MGINQGAISLDQKYTASSGHVFLTGIQALVRLPMAQIRRDRAAGAERTAGGGLQNGFSRNGKQFGFLCDLCLSLRTLRLKSLRRVPCSYV